MTNFGWNVWPFDSYEHELVFGVGVQGLSKADRLIYGESLMTHAMVLTAVLTTEVSSRLLVCDCEEYC